MKFWVVQRPGGKRKDAEGRKRDKERPVVGDWVVRERRAGEGRGVVEKEGERRGKTSPCVPSQLIQKYLCGVR